MGGGVSTQSVETFVQNQEPFMTRVVEKKDKPVSTRSKPVNKHPTPAAADTSNLEKASTERKSTRSTVKVAIAPPKEDSSTTRSVTESEYKLLLLEHEKLKQENTAMRTKLTKLQQHAENSGLGDTEVGKELEKTRKLLVAAEKRADTLLKRSGQNHIKRDWERLKGGTPFPAGSDLRESFVVTFLNFESFACDAIFALENLGHSETVAADVFVTQVMLPLYAGCKGYVDAQLQVRREEMQKTFGMALPDDLTNDSVPKLFWFLSLQAHLPALVKALGDGDIEALIAATDRDHAGVLGAVHARMLEDARAGLISDSDSDLRMPQLVRALLLLFTHAALSDPNCYLQPAPGTQLAYHPDRCKEILSPGAKKHGLIKEGDTVEVVLPGLYFGDGTPNDSATAVMVTPCLVRRLTKRNLEK